MSKQPKGKFELDDYADVMIEFREFCESNALNFRRELAGWATARMRGKDAPAQAGPAAAAPPPPPTEPTDPRTERSDDVRESIVNKTVNGDGPAPAAAAVGVVVTAGASPAARVIELVRIRESIDQELGRLMVAMGIPVAPALAAAAPAPRLAAAPEPEPEPSEASEPGVPPDPQPAREPRARRARGRAARPAADTAPAKPAGMGRGRPLACDEFPGRVFTHPEVRELCGVAPQVPLAGYVAKGQRVGRKHVFRWATAAEIAAATAGGGQETQAAPEGDGDDDGGDDEMALTGWECTGCFTQYPEPAVLPPRKCKRCSSTRFRRARKYATAS